MLQSLYIDNYALIDNLRIEFKKGLSIITGETGAGKSILLGALSLIIGKRADTSVLYDKSKKCIVEGTFIIRDYQLESFFSDNDIDYDDQAIIRREINASGKSRAFINDTPVTLEVLGALTVKLVDIHSQHENLALNDHVFQLNVIDLYGNNQDLLSEYRETYHSYRQLVRRYEEYAGEMAKLKADFDYYQFQFSQLEETKLSENEQEELESELKQLSHAEEIKSALEHATDILSGENENLVNNLKSLQNLIGRLSGYLPEASSLAERIESTYIEIKDIHFEIENVNSRISLDPGRLGFISQRLDMIYSLQQKHGVRTIPELLAIQKDLQEKLENINTSDVTLHELEKALNQTLDALGNLSERLTKRRKNTFSEITGIVTNLLVDLGIPNALFSISHMPLDEFTANGRDQVRFLFSANKNAPLQEISRIASGGELSRVMLSIKSLISHSAGLPTIILDEIDAGVSGEIADKVGTIIKNMSAGMQVINITHLPQVASKGDQHYLVYKKDQETSTKTYITLLNEEERHIEIAKMLSGKELTSAALDNARELLKN